MLLYGVSDIGRVRRENQDCFMNCSFGKLGDLAVVCDGMGGLAGGQEASSVACDAFVFSFSVFMNAQTEASLETMSAQDIHAALTAAAWDANMAVFQRKNENPEHSQMGTTLVAAFVRPDRAYVINIGDSRLFWIHDGLAEQVTKDHSLVQYLVDIGQMTREEAAVSRNKNIITRAIGISASPEPDLFTVDFHGPTQPQYLLLCSDGFSNMKPAGEIYAYFDDEARPVTDEESISSLVRRMVDDANELGAPDNVTVDVVAVFPAEESPESAGE